MTEYLIPAQGWYADVILADITEMYLLAPILKAMLTKPGYPPETLCVIRGLNVIPEGPRGLSGNPLHVIVG